MKKETFIILVFVLALALLIPLSQALTVSINKDNYQPQETLQGEITGNFISLNKDNIFIYKNETPRPTPVKKDLIKKNNKYYFYTILPNQEGNFSLKIENAKYITNGDTNTSTITKEFSINHTSEPIIQIDPGFIYTNEDFSINVKSLNNDLNLNAEFKATGESKNLSLIEDLEETLFFKTPKNNTDSKIIFEFGEESSGGWFSSTTSLTQEVPVFIYNQNQDEPERTNETINKTINYNETSNETHKETINTENMTEEETSKLNCEEMGGEVCTTNQTCTGEEVSSLQGPCCTAECESNEESSTGWIIGIILFIIVAAILTYVYFNYKKQNSKSPDEILKSKTNNNPNKNSSKTSGSLFKG